MCSLLRILPRALTRPVSCATPGRRRQACSRHTVDTSLSGSEWPASVPRLPRRALLFLAPAIPRACPVFVILIHSHVAVCMLARSPERPSTAEVATGSFPPPPLRLHPGGCEPGSRAGVAPTEVPRLSRRSVAPADDTSQEMPAACPLKACNAPVTTIDIV